MTERTARPWWLDAFDMPVVGYETSPRLDDGGRVAGDRFGTLPEAIADARSDVGPDGVFEQVFIWPVCLTAGGDLETQQHAWVACLERGPQGLAPLEWVGEPLAARAFDAAPDILCLCGAPIIPSLGVCSIQGCSVHPREAPLTIRWDLDAHRIGRELRRNAGEIEAHASELRRQAGRPADDPEYRLAVTQARALYTLAEQLDPIPPSLPEALGLTEEHP